MAISEGDAIPDTKVMLATKDGPQEAQTAELFAKGKYALFAVPGAFTPTCSAKHLPGFQEHAAALREKGVDTIYCMSVNDAFVMQAWRDQQKADAVEMIADGNGNFTQALGLEMDGAAFGLGRRSQRFSAIIEDGVVKTLNVEAPGAFEASSAEKMLEQL